MFNEQEFVGYGIEPDVFLELTVKDLLNEQDLVLKKGLEIKKRRSK